MKKWIGLCVCLMVLSLAFGALAAPGDNMLFFREPNTADSENMTSMAGTDKGLYVLKSELGNYSNYQIAFYDYETQAITTLLDNLPEPYYSTQEEFEMYGGGGKVEDIINRLFVSDNKLYGINYLTGEVFELVINDNVATRNILGKIDPALLLVTMSDYSYFMEIWGLVIDEGALYLSTYNYENNASPASLLRCDLEKGTNESVAKLSVMEMKDYKDGLLLAILYDPYNSYDEATNTSKPRELHTLDLKTGKTSLLYSSQDAFAGVQYDSENDTIYFTQGSQVLRLLKDGKTETVAYLPSSDTYSTQGAAFSKGLYSYASYSGITVRNTDPQYLPSTVLTIYGGWAGDSEMSFVKQNPDIAFNFPNQYIDTVEQLAQTISSDSKLDIIQTSTYMDFDALIKKDYCTDLSAYPELMALVENMHPYLKDFVMRDGKLYAIPIYSYAYGPAYNTYTLNELDMTADDLPTTYAELCDFITEWNDDLSYDYPDYFPMYYGNVRSNLFYAMLDSYCLYYAAIGEDLTFSTPLFKSILAAFESMHTDNLDREGMSEEEMWNRTPIIDTGYQVVEFSSLDPTDPKLNYSMNWPIKLADDIPAYYSTSAQLAFISPNSKNTDAAVKYLVHLLNNMSVTEKPFVFANMQGDIESPYYQQMITSWDKEVERIKKALEDATEDEKAMYEEQLKYYEEDMANRDRYRYAVTQKAMDYFRDNIASQCVLYTGNPLYNNETGGELMPIIERYMAKEISGDQMISEIDRKLYMIQRESR